MTRKYPPRPEHTEMSSVAGYLWYTKLDGMEAFLYTEGIQLTAAHSGGRCSDLTQEVQHL